MTSRWLFYIDCDRMSMTDQTVSAEISFNHGDDSEIDCGAGEEGNEEDATGGEDFRGELSLFDGGGVYGGVFYEVSRGFVFGAGGAFRVGVVSVDSWSDGGCAVAGAEGGWGFVSGGGHRDGVGAALPCLSDARVSVFSAGL